VSAGRETKKNCLSRLPVMRYGFCGTGKKKERGQGLP